MSHDINSVCSEKERGGARYLTVDGSTEEAYAIYLSYMVQRAFYELCRRESGGEKLAWEDTVMDFRASGKLRRAAAEAVKRALLRLGTEKAFRFDRPDAPSVSENLPAEEDGKLRYARLFSPEEERALVGLLMLRAERAQFAQRKAARPADYSWEAYLEDLEKKGALWEELCAGVRDALDGLELEAAWTSEQVQSLLREE